VAVLLGGVTERYVWTLLSRNELTSVKIGGRRLVPAEDLDQFIANLREQERQARAASAA
jgi:excisionase family DNA binding protein